MTRPSRDQYFMGLAYGAATRGTCPRRSVGALLVMDGDNLSTGYNGAPKDMPHCDLHGCELDAGGHCENAVHAENNAITKAMYDKRGSTLYVTTLPCRRCMGMIINAEVARIVYGDEYSDPTHTSNAAAWTLQAAKHVGIEIVKWVPEKPSNE